MLDFDYQLYMIRIVKSGAKVQKTMEIIFNVENQGG